MTIHHLKIQRQPFEDLVSGRKTGEVRNCADREFREGDQVELFLMDETGNPSNKSIVRTITHIQRGYGLPDDICVLSYAATGVEREEPAAYLCQGKGSKWLQYGSKVADPWLPGEVECTPLYARQPAPILAAPDERTEFVAWVRREWPQAPLSNVRDLLPKGDPRYGEYCDETLQRAWVGWQARAALVGKS